MIQRANEVRARKAATRVLDDLAIDSHPVDPFLVAERIGIPVDEVSGFPSQCYGALTIVDGRFRIMVSTNCPTDGFRRFTVSHEIGHAAIEGHVDLMEWVDQGDKKIALSEAHYTSMKRPIEAEADHFASELLMPRRWAQRFVDSLSPGIDAIETIANMFGTSLSSAGVRFAQLSSAPLMVMLSRDGAIEWIAASREIQQANFYRRTSRRGVVVPRGSATHRLSADHASVLEGTRADSGGNLREWFSHAPAGVSVEVEALGLGTYGRVLSLVLCENLPDADELYLDEINELDINEGGRDWRSELRRQAGYSDD